MSPNAKRLLTLFLALLIASLACNLPREEVDRTNLEATGTTRAEQDTGTRVAQTMTAAAERGETPVPADTPIPPPPVPTLDLACTWNLIEATPALATGGGDPNMKAEWDGAWIGTRFKHAGNFGCDEQEFVTAHEWDGLRSELIPGETYSWSVALTWRLEGTAECSSLTAGAKTSLTAGSTVLEIGQSTIILDMQPDGDLFNSGEWTAPSGNEGDILTIKAHGSSGSLGGTISYNYELVCSPSE